MKTPGSDFQSKALVLTLMAAITVSVYGVDTIASRSSFLCFRGGGEMGGAGGISPSLQWLDLSPVEDVVKNEADLGLYKFNFSDNGFMLIGGMGYGGSRCGVKLGGGGWFGYKKFASTSRNVFLRDSLGAPIFKNDTMVKVDSAAQLYTMIAYGGFLAEKNFSIGDFTFALGGLFGGGALILGKDFISKENNSTFTDASEFDTTDMASSWTAAPLFCFDVHSGFSYRISSFMVIGADANLLFFHANEGFNFNTDSFLTVNPGIRFRILFGNLG